MDNTTTAVYQFGIQVPSYTSYHMWDYISSDGAEIHPSALPMYKEGWTMSALGAKENRKTNVQMLVRAEMKKLNRYHVYIVLDTDGNVDGAHCVPLEVEAQRGANLWRPLFMDWNRSQEPGRCKWR